ncbi:MAG: TetR/AcrR family transcriptional regulator, partial [Syntrophobacteraceae bacterium]|nr:TetR/AcrR family transcriptional regulator [Syntrophobacteraceae bacterium]
MNENVAEKKETILQAAQDILAEKGLRQSTVSEIARRAGVFDSEIYRYYKNKEDLLFYSLSERLEGVMKELMFHFSGIIGATNKLSKMIWFHLNINDNESDSTRVLKYLLFECRSNSQFYSHPGYDSLRRYAGIMVSILKEGVESSAFRSDFSLHLVREMVFGLLDEEALSCLLIGEVDKTIPDFEPIMSLVFAMIQNGTHTHSPEDTNDKFRRIIESAKRVFANKGYDKATIAEIANDARVAERTIYEMFKTKEDLLLAISEDKFSSQNKYIESLFEPEEPLAKLQRLIYYFSNLLLSDPSFAIVFLRDTKLNKKLNIKSYSYLFDCISTLYKILDEGKKDGTFREDIDNRVFKNLFFGAFSHLTVRWFVVGKVTPIKMMEELNEVSSLLCRSVTRRLDML